jgi:hypothetical protein
LYHKINRDKCVLMLMTEIKSLSIRKQIAAELGISLNAPDVRKLNSRNVEISPTPVMRKSMAEAKTPDKHLGN